MISDANIHQLFQKMGKTVLDHSFLGKGEASVVYKVTTDNGIFALKTALYPERKKKILQEAEFRKFFIEKGMNCVPPPVLSDDSIFPNGAVVYDYVEGGKLDFSDTEVITQFAKIASKLHQIDYEVLDDGFSNIEKLSSFMKKLTSKIVSDFPHLINPSIKSAFDIGLQEWKEMMPIENKQKMIGINAQLHGDLSDNFVIDSKKKIWLLDWENSEYGDIIDELCWLLSCNDFSLEQRSIFFKEYQNQFPKSKDIKFEDLYLLYSSANLILNICFGMDQLAMNIEQKMGPERKLRDLAYTVKGWNEVYSEKAFNYIKEGIEILAQKLS